MSAPVALLPQLPAVPTAPMAAHDRRALADALGSLRRRLHEPSVQQHILDGYARVWLHLVLQQGLDPRKAVAAKLPDYQAVLPTFMEAAERIGLHRKPQAAWWAPRVSQQACMLWRKASAAQGQAPQPLPGLGLDPIGTVRPAWMRGLESAALADPRG